MKSGKRLALVLKTIVNSMPLLFDFFVSTQTSARYRHCFVYVVPEFSRNTAVTELDLQMSRAGRI